MYENSYILIPTSLKFIPHDPVNNKQALSQIVSCQWTYNKVLSEPVMTYLTDAYMHKSALMS